MSTGHAGVAPRSSAGDLLRVLRRLPALGLLGLLRVYQTFISPLTPPSCRYYPSCSAYAVVAVQRHGALRGGWLAVRRLARCHPWTPGGVDDVPPVRTETTARATGHDTAHGHDHAHGHDRPRSSTR